MNLAIFEEEKTLDQLMKELDRAIVQCYADPGLIATEGLLTNILSKIADTIIMSFNTLRTNVFMFWRQLKRTEITEYSHANMTMIKRIESLPMSELNKVSVYVPHGFKGTYMEAMQLLSKFFEEYDNKKYMQDLYGKLEDVYLSLVEREDPTKNLTAMISTMEMKNKKTISILKVLDKLYTNESALDINFSKVFANVKEYTQVRKSMLDMDYVLTGINAVEKLLSKVEIAFDKILKLIQETEEVTRKELGDLATMAKLLANTFTAYGTAAMDLQVLEHNYVESGKRIAKELF